MTANNPFRDMESRRRPVDPPYGGAQQQYQNQNYGRNDNYGYDHGGYGSGTPPALTTVLDHVPLGTDSENSKLLDLIDRLRECRVDSYIDLPQVVVVGDQSSGKSSVLEAITQIPFPTSSTACTRFATQIRLRRDNSLSATITKVSILANKPKDQARYASFAQVVDEGMDFTEIFQSATDLIFQDRSGNFLSKDILSIERIGPGLSHVTLVDLPGIIHNPTKTQTVEDVRAIAQLSKEYMSKDRTIILPIVGCDSEYARQIIIKNCKDADPAGIRTLGVITKPDMTLTAEREAEFIDLACNRDERNKLLLGWHVLKNRAHNERDFTTEQRDAEEKKYFANSRWSSLDESQLGIERLRKKLSTQLIRHIANEVFKVQGDIERHLEDCKAKLKNLGPGLETIDQMKAELLNLCKRSGSLTREAVQGHGINPLGEDFFPKYNDSTTRFARNLRARVVIKNENFSERMEKQSASFLIEGTSLANQAQQTPMRGGVQNARAPSVISRREFVEREVKPLIRDNPGQELSVDINPRLVYRLFQSYSANWPGHADDHLGEVQICCEQFLREVMAYAWPSRLQTKVWRYFIQQAMDDRFRIAVGELDELKKDRFRNIRAYHSSFDASYYKMREAQPDKNKDSSPMNKYEDTLNKMLLYYEHQLPTFISNVITQAVERHLIDSMEAIFDSERIHKLDENVVKQIMEEDYGTANERKQLNDQREVLQNGLDICRQIAGRGDLGPVGFLAPL
jgi:GTP-binding protein EngB required for normal cell division